MATARDNWLAEPYVKTDPAQEALDRASEEVSEDQITAALELTAMSESHEWLANSADLIGRVLKNPSVRLAISVADLKALDVLSRIADSAWDEREAAILKCALAAIAEAK